MVADYVDPIQIADPATRPPDVLDWLEFKFEGITIRVRGVLHGLTGGANREYIDLVERSIADARKTGLVMAEKSMRSMYRARIDKELDDWLVFRPRDAFRLGARLYFTPSLLLMLVAGGFRERLTRADAFEVGGRIDPDLLGGSPLFHRIDPFERRALSGFPPPLEGVRRHLMLRAGVDVGDEGRAIVPGRHWAHLNKIERFSLIPIRSVHMLVYAAIYARRRGLGFVNVFVGETHNTDMKALAESWDVLRSEDSVAGEAFRKIVAVSARAAGGRMGRFERMARYAAYIGAVAAPLAITAAAIVGVAAVFAALPA